MPFIKSIETNLFKSFQNTREEFETNREESSVSITKLHFGCCRDTFSNEDVHILGSRSLTGSLSHQLAPLWHEWGKRNISNGNLHMLIPIARKTNGCFTWKFTQTGDVELGLLKSSLATCHRWVNLLWGSSNNIDMSRTMPLQAPCHMQT